MEVPKSSLSILLLRGQALYTFHSDHELIMKLVRAKGWKWMDFLVTLGIISAANPGTLQPGTSEDGVSNNVHLSDEHWSLKSQEELNWLKVTLGNLACKGPQLCRGAEDNRLESWKNLPMRNLHPVQLAQSQVKGAVWPEDEQIR